MTVRSAVLVALLCVAWSAARADDVPPAPAADAGGVVFEPGTPAFADALAKAKAEGKPLFVDFATEWCGWCKKLDADVYTKASVGAAMKAFVNVRIDAEKGEGPDLAKRFAVHGFPTLVVVDASGEEIDRIVGYLPEAKFVKEVGRIAAGDGTLASLRKAAADKPDDVSAGLAYAVKLGRANPDAASESMAKLETQAKEKSDRPALATISLERAASALDAAGSRDAVVAVASDAETLLKDYADTPAAGHAATRLGRAFLAVDPARALAFLAAARAAAKDPEDRINVERYETVVHKSAIAASLKRQAAAAGDDPQALNEAAWTSFEQKVNVKEALGWAKTAAEKSNRDPAILDTLANLLWLVGKHDDALKTEEEAAGKVDASMKSEFLGTIAKWKVEAKSGKDGDGDDDEDGDEGGEGGEKK